MFKRLNYAQTAPTPASSFLCGGGGGGGGDGGRRHRRRRCHCQKELEQFLEALVYHGQHHFGFDVGANI